VPDLRKFRLRQQADIEHAAIFDQRFVRVQPQRMQMVRKQQANASRAQLVLCPVDDFRASALGYERQFRKFVMMVRIACPDAVMGNEQRQFVFSELPGLQTLLKDRKRSHGLPSPVRIVCLHCINF